MSMSVKVVSVLVVVVVCFCFGFLTGRLLREATTTPVVIPPQPVSTEVTILKPIPLPTRRIELLIVHHTGVVVDQMHGDYVQDVDRVRQYHLKERGWSDIGYHYIVDPLGQVHPGRPLERSGAHAKGYNHNSIGICLLGNFELQEPTVLQTASLRGLITSFKAMYPDLKILGHCEVGCTLCPGKYLQGVLGTFK